MPAVVGSATIRILPDSSGFSAALNSQLNGLTQSLGAMGGRNITGNLNRQLKTLGDSLQRTGNRSVLVGEAFTYGLTRPLLAAGKAVLGAAADFDEAARTVAAVTIPDPIKGVFESLDEFEVRVQEFKDSAREMARETVFSSTEVEKAYVDLARAGLTSADQIESVIGTVANVALVEGGQMSEFSDKMVQIFTGFGGNFEEIGSQYETIFGDVRATTADLTAEFEHMGDILTLTSQRTVTDITDLAVAFRYAGPTAKAAGLSFEETAAGLGLLAQAGFSASMGGTALRGIITRLAIPTKLSEEVFEKFGLTMEQAFQTENAAKLQDSLVAMGAAQEDIDEIMSGGIQGFRDAEKAVAGYGFEVFNAAGEMKPLVDIVQEFVDKGARVGDVGKVFGQRAGPAFQGLMDNLPALKRLTVELDGAEGALDRMAERMKSSAAVQFKLLKNSLTELAIAFGESGALGFFADIAADVRDFALGLGDTNPEVLKFIGLAASLVAAIGPLGITIGLLQKGFGQFFHLFAFALTPLGAMTLAIGALATGVGFLAARSEPLRDALADLYDTAVLIAKPLLEIGKALGSAFEGEAGSGLDTLTTRITKFFEDINISVNEWIASGGLRDVMQQIIEMISVMGDAWEAIKPAINAAVTEIGETGRVAFDLLVVVVTEVSQGLSHLAHTILPVLGVAFGVAWTAAGAGLDVLEGLFKFLKPIADVISDVLGPGLLLLGQAFLIARINGFHFLEVFRAFRTEGLAAAQVAVQLNSRMGALSKTFGAMFSSLGGGVSAGAAFGSLTSMLVSGAGRLVIAFGRAISPIGSVLARVFGGMSSIGAVMDAGRSLTAALVRGMISGFARGATVISASLYGFLTGIFDRPLSRMRGVWSNFWLSSSAVAYNALSRVNASVTGAFDKINTTVTMSVVKMRSSFQSLTLSGIFNGLKAAAAGAGPAIADVGRRMVAMATESNAAGQSMGTRLMNTFNNVFGGIAANASKTATAVMGAMRRMTTVLSVAAQGAMAFSSGLMLGEATDMRSKLMALIPAITGIGIAAASVTGPLGLVVLGITALATVAGVKFGQMGKDVDLAVDSVDAFTQAFSELDARVRHNQIFDQITSEYNDSPFAHPDQTGFVSIELQLREVGLSVGQMTTALDKGGRATEEFFKKWRDGWIKAQLAKGFEDGSINLANFAQKYEELTDKFSERPEVATFDELRRQLEMGRISQQAYEDGLRELGVAEEEAAEKLRPFNEVLGDVTDNMYAVVDAAAAMARGIDPSGEFSKQRDAFAGALRSLLSSTDGFIEEGATVGSRFLDAMVNTSDLSEFATTVRGALTPLTETFLHQSAAFAAIPGQTGAEIAAGMQGLRQSFVDMLVTEGQMSVNDATAFADAIIAKSGAMEVAMGGVLDPTRATLAGMAADADHVDAVLKAAEERSAENAKILKDNFDFLTDEQIAAFTSIPTGAGGGVVNAPVPQVPATVQIRPGEVVGMPTNGVPAEALIQVKFSSIENMDTVVAGITNFVSTVANALLGVAGGIETVSMRLGDMIRNVVTLFGVLGSSATMASFVVVGAVSRMVLALSQIPLVMSEVSRSLLTGFSRPFSIIANAVWNPFASFINIASRSLGMGSLLPTGMSIPVFHKGGVVGDATGDSYDGSRSLKSDEMMALLQRGEGVMSEQMMANMTDSQLRAFRAGEKRWWAVGGPYESGGNRASNRVGAGADPMSMGGDFGQIRAMYEGSIKPLLNSVGGIGGSSVERIGDGSMDYMRGFNDTIESKKAAYLSSVGLPPGFNLSGAVPTGFDVGGWRSFLGANYGKSGNYPLLISYLQAAGIPHLVNSTVRPGSITTSGNRSRHATGRAVDFGAPGDANYDSAGLLRINRAFAPMLGVLGELIYSGPGGITDKAYGAAVMAGHHNHVHVALARGGIIDELTYAMLGEGGKREVVLPMSDPVRALSLAKRSGLLKMLSEAQSAAPSSMAPSSRSSSSASFDGGPLGGGPGNTYNINGVGLDQVKREISARDEASLRRRR